MALLPSFAGRDMGISASKDDYAGCLKDAKLWEDAVQKFLKSMGWKVFRNDATDFTRLDFGLTLFFDLKYRGVPFRKAKHYVGLDPDEAVPLDTNKMERYSKFEGGMLLLIVDYLPEVSTQGVYLISVAKVLALMKKHGEKRVHHYKDRKTDNKNSRSSFYVSIHECMKLPDLFFNLIQKSFQGA